MPRDRLSVAQVHAALSGDRLDYAATLSLDGNTVATIVHPHNGGVEIPFLEPRVQPTDLDVFVDACRWRGRAVSRDTA